MVQPWMVPKVRLELTRGYPHYALNVARLPIPPLRLGSILAPDERSRYLRPPGSPEVTMEATRWWAVLDSNQ